MRKYVFLIGLLLSQAALSQVYRWVDEDGVVHFTDRPTEGAELVELPKAPPTDFKRIRPVTVGAAGESQQGSQTEQAAGYNSLTVVQPSDEETLWNIGATLDVSLSLTPALRPGDEIEVWFDGSKLDRQDPTALNFTIDEVYRGTHRLWARVVNPGDQVMIQSNDVTFYVQQTSIINPP